ncbi:MAG: SPOR domain-containing protein, partial [Bacteroidales bacterium]
MTVRKAYSKFVISGNMLLTLIRKVAFLYFILTFSQSTKVFSQDLPEYDEISVFLEIPSLGGSEIDALIRGEELYLPVTNLFDFLKIRNVPSADLQTITGFFINPEAEYSVSQSENMILYQNKRFDLNPGDLIRTETNLYLKSVWYGRVFGLECSFNFRTLSVSVKSKLELPLIREMKQEEMRRNLSRLKGDIEADTIVRRTYPMFKFGMADWSATASQEINGRSDTRINLALGSMIAGGEATASLYYNSLDRVSEKQQYYLWRYVNNDFAPIRQVMAGKIHSNAIASLYNPVVGVQLTNTPTTYRRSFGTYNLSDRTDPGWIVELYVNNVLVDYVKADASGFFTFEVPLVYGNSIIKLKFFGPWGEERTREQNITIPYNFLPEKTLEYTLSAGIVEDTLKSRFSRASVNYGATKSLTVGAGAEYLSSVTSQPFMPYVNASVRITSNLLLSGEYALGVRAKGTLTYRLPSNLQLDLNYTWYDKDQKAIFYNYREERRAALTIPLKIGKIPTFQRVSLYQIVLPASKYTTGEWLISGSLFGVNTNLTTYALFIDKVKPYLYSNLSLAFRLPAGFVLMPQAQYSYTENKLFSARAKIEKRVIERGYINLSYEQNFRNDLKLAEAGFRYDFSFAQFGASVRRYSDKTSFIQYARGSLINDRKTKYLGADNRTNVGRGGISIVPYLDLNNNGIKDPGEPKAFGLNLHSNGGHIEKSDRDTTIRILGLEPYTNCFIDLDPNSFDNISWRLSKQTYNVAVDPNILKLIEIPVSIMGEATGYVYLESEGEKRGLGRMIINFYDNDLKHTGRTLSEDDGFYSYLGLKSGKYNVQVDTAQLRKLKMTSAPEILQFSIAGGLDGDIAEGLDFVIKMIPDTAKTSPVIPEVPIVKKDTSYVIIHEVTEEVYTITEDSWAIQIGAFRQRSLAEGFRSMLEKELGKDVQITIAGDFYRVRILDLPTRQEVDENIIKLNKLGFKELWIIRLLARQKQILLVTKEDSLLRIKESLIERETPLLSPDMIEIQLGAFRLRSNAYALRERLSASLDKEVT